MRLVQIHTGRVVYRLFGVEYIDKLIYWLLRTDFDTDHYDPARGAAKYIIVVLMVTKRKKQGNIYLSLVEGISTENCRQRLRK